MAADSNRILSLRNLYLSDTRLFEKLDEFLDLAYIHNSSLFLSELVAVEVALGRSQREFVTRNTKTRDRANRTPQSIRRAWQFFLAPLEEVVALRTDAGSAWNKPSIVSRMRRD